MSAFSTMVSLTLFLSTPSARRATCTSMTRWLVLPQFLSTPSARRATTDLRVQGQRLDHFYPRPPRGGRRDAGASGAELGEFLSTPSARRATWVQHFLHGGERNFYPRPPRGGRRRGYRDRPDSVDFYPRPPRGGRPASRRMLQPSRIFLSTPSARRATRRVCRNTSRAASYFAPRPPRGGRPKTRTHFIQFDSYFYPRPPRGGRPPYRYIDVSRWQDFYPRPPRGGRQRPAPKPHSSRLFLSTPSARRATILRSL